MIFETVIIFPAPKYPAGDWQPSGLRFEDVLFHSADGTRLHGWFFDQPQARFHLLYCHGNADFVPNLATYADELRRRFGCSVFIFDYRGYGKSQGRPSEAGILADGRAARQWLCQRTGAAPDEIVLMGRSLGGAVAVDLAANGGAGAVALENTFTSIPDVAARLFPLFPVRWLLRTQLNSLATIGDYSGPLFISHGDADEIVSPEHGQRLYEAAAGPKQLFTIVGGRHNDPQPEDYFHELDAFLSRFTQHIAVFSQE